MNNNDFLATKYVEIPQTSRSADWLSTSDAIAELRLEVQRLRTVQPVEVPVKSHKLDSLPIDTASGFKG
jgi:hypothetical protein